MKSRERIMRTLAHQEADRIPVDFDCSQSDKVEDLVRYTKSVNKEAMLQMFGVDLR